MACRSNEQPVIVFADGASVALMGPTFHQPPEELVDRCSRMRQYHLRVAEVAADDLTRLGSFLSRTPQGVAIPCAEMPWTLGDAWRFELYGFNNSTPHPEVIARLQQVHAEAREALAECDEAIRSRSFGPVLARLAKLKQHAAKAEQERQLTLLHQVLDARRMETATA
jgi:hypothetical protein